MKPEKKEQARKYLEKYIGGFAYPDKDQTQLMDFPELVFNELTSAGCNDYAALVAAYLGDLPYSPYKRSRVGKIFGKRSANAWHEFKNLDVSGHQPDDGSARADCTEHLLIQRAPKMSAPARVALLGWFSLHAKRVAGDYAPIHWDYTDKKRYLNRIKNVTKAILQEERKVVLSPVIKKLGERILKTIHDHN